jgi:hypothetical protein
MTEEEISKMTEEEIIKEQLKFVKWLKKKGMYNPFTSTRDMQTMHEIWAECQIDLKNALDNQE